jgi:putative cell wall-binding protein
MQRRREAAFVLLTAALAVASVTVAPAASGRPLMTKAIGVPCPPGFIGEEPFCTPEPTIIEPTTTTEAPTTTTTSTTSTSTTTTTEAPTTTSTSSTTSTTAAAEPAPPPTTTPSTTSTTVDVSSEDPGSIEIPADQSRATVRPGGDVEVSTNVSDVGEDETPIAPGTRIEAQVKVAEGDTEPLFTVEAEVAEDGSVSFDVTFPEDTEPGVYLVVVVLPGETDADGNVLRRPRVAIATVVVRGRAGRSATGKASSHKRADAQSVRYGGADRYETAEAVATETFDGALAPIVTTGEAFPDALASSYIAGAMRTPILLTPSDAMAPGLPDALARLGATGVEIVGGTDAVSEAVRAEIEAAGFATTRLAGVDRYDTARQIATLIPSEGIGQLEDHGLTAILVSGTSFADALTAGPMSYSQGWPVLLTGADALHPMARRAIEDAGIEHVIVVGGTAAVSDDVVGELGAIGVTVERLAGADRAGTALAVAEFLYDRLSYDGNDVLLARGDEFADALAAAPRAGDEIMPILLVAPDALGDDARAFIRAHADVLELIEIVGGTGAVSDSVWVDAMHEAGATG